MIKGYWNKTWSPSDAPPEATLGIAFSGWAEPDKALYNSAQIKETLVGDKYISLGGGNENGKFDDDNLDRIITSINDGIFSGYNGIAFDIEECNSGLIEKFQKSFSLAKQKDLRVLVTVSHTAPYGPEDAKDLMSAFFLDENIDYLSPQLYSQGDELQNDFTENMGVTWMDYKNTRALIVPSIINEDMYESAKNFFAEFGINIEGFIQWKST